MKIRITGPGIYASDGQEIPIGTEMTVKEKPLGWVGRYEIVSDTKDKTPVTNDEAPKRGRPSSKGDDE